MIHATRRGVCRSQTAGRLKAGRETLAGVAKMLEGIPARHFGRYQGARIMYGLRYIRDDAHMVFIHPTKRATPGRVGFVQTPIKALMQALSRRADERAKAA